MKVPKPTYQSALGRAQPEAMDTEAIKQHGWREQRILVVQLTDERLDWLEREIVRRIGERLYGAPHP